MRVRCAHTPHDAIVWITYHSSWKTKRCVRQWDSRYMSRLNTTWSLFYLNKTIFLDTILCWWKQHRIMCSFSIDRSTQHEFGRHCTSIYCKISNSVDQSFSSVPGVRHATHLCPIYLPLAIVSIEWEGIQNVLHWEKFRILHFIYTDKVQSMPRLLLISLLYMKDNYN